MKKFLFALFCFLTFGLILTPICFARSYSYDDLNINRYYGYEEKTTSSSYNYYYIKVNYPTTRISSNNNVLCFEIFNNDLSIPNYTGLVSSAYLCAKTVNGYSQTVNLSNTTNATSGAKYFYYSVTAQNWNTTSYEYLQIGCPSSIDLNDYSIQICFIANSTGYLPFTPNSYYQLYSTSEFGGVSDLKMYSVYQYTSETNDITELVSFYNIMSLTNCAFIYQNNDTNTYQYSLKVDFNNRIGSMPQYKVDYMEPTYITIDNERLSYANARNKYAFINTNLTLYSTDNLIFIDFESASSHYLNSIEFRIADYTFKSSSYFNSTLGIKGYIQNTNLYVGVANDKDQLNSWYDKGYKDGFSNGEYTGYNNAMNEKSTSFDNLFFAIGGVPIQIISSILNFEILGFNLLSFFMAIITLVLFVGIVKKLKE